MCGIAGVYGAHRSAADLHAALEAMNAAQFHRGPDEGGLVTEAALGAGLACRRLSIVDLDHGQQPVSNEDGTIHAVLNGEIYNHGELREMLVSRGHRFVSRCDTEVIVHLYEEQGERFLESLHGMFGLAVLDTRERRLLLARDGPGMKPLYWTEGPEGLLFASEVRALFATGWVSPEPDPAAMDAFLMVAYVPSPMSMFRGIRKLEPGQWLTADASGVRTGFFWRFHYDNSRPEKTDDEYADEMDDTLHSAVRSHLAADVPVGAFLSGGWDSSLITAMAVREAGARLKTFSIVFPDDPGIDESRFSRLMARHLGTEHHEIEYRSADLAKLLPGVVRHLEEPFAAGPCVLGFQLAHLASRHVKTVISGEGADELLGGYEWMRFNWPYLLRRLTPAWSTRLALRYVRHHSWRRALSIFGAPSPAAADAEWRRSFSPAEKSRLLKPEFRSGGPDREAVMVASDVLATCADSVQRRLAHDSTARLAEGLLFSIDKLTMAHSLEVRMPFLDRRVVDLVLRLPSRLKVWKGREKVILSKLAQRHLPTRIAARRKRGLGYPLGSWTSGAGARFAREVLLDGARNGPFDRAVLEPNLERWLGPLRDASRVAPLVTLQCWWNEFCSS